jgi:hypothetical protein
LPILAIALLLPAIGALIWHILPAQLDDSELIRGSLTNNLISALLVPALSSEFAADEVESINIGATEVFLILPANQILKTIINAPEKSLYRSSTRLIF